MARTIESQISGHKDIKAESPIQLEANSSDHITVPHSGFVSDAAISREGQDLILEAPGGETIIIEGYFLSQPAPIIMTNQGDALTPQLVESFVKTPMTYAQAGSLNDESPVGAVEDMKGDAVIIRADGTQETASIGTPIYPGDIVETSGSGAVNITFLDETSMAISENARFAINDYTFNPSNESGTTNFSVLRGVFVFTSGLIGREDPDDVEIETPVGSIGIRGTVIAGNIQPDGNSEISVLEGAIVLRNATGEKTLSTQFETVQLGGFNDPIPDSNVLSSNDISNRFGAVSDVAPNLFSALNDNSSDSQQDDASEDTNTQDGETEASQEDGTSENTQSADEVGDSTDQGLDSDAGTESNADPIINDPTLGDVLTDTGFGRDNFANDTANTDSNNAGNNLAGTSDSRTDNTSDIADNSTNETRDNASDSTAEPPPFLDEFREDNDDNNGNSSTGGTTSPPPLPTPLIINAASAADGISIINDDIGNHIGFDLDGIGDINNDGFADFIFTNNTNVAAQNNTYTVYGSATGIESGLLPGNASVVVNALSIPGGAPGETVVSYIGDFDGNGSADYVIGQKDQITNAGPVISGAAAIIDSSNPGALFSLFENLSTGDDFGTSVAGVGDVNNDGFDDVLISAPNGNGAFTDNGLVYLVYGGLNPIGTTIDATTLTSTNGFVFEGGAAGDQFGESVTSTGNFSGGSISTFAIGTPNINHVTIQSDGGTILDIHHTTTGYGLGEEVQGAGDIDGDGLTDLMIVGDVDNEAFFVAGGTVTNISDIDGAVAGSNAFKINTGTADILGGGSVGDWNGDGYDDFALAVNNGTDASIYVLYGHGGLFTETVIDQAYLDQDVNAFQMVYQGGGTLDFTFNGVGDVNGDGFDDFAIGNETFNFDNDAIFNDGQVIVIEGRDARGFVNKGDDAVANNMSASSVGDSLVGGQENDILFDGGHTDTSLRGGAGSDTFQISNDQFMSIDGGFGDDAISMQSSFLDFTNIDFEQINSIETLQMGQNSQTVRLTLDNIFNLLKSSDNGEIYIDANSLAGTILELDLNGNGTDNLVGTSNTPAEIVTALNAEGALTSLAGTPPTGYSQFDIGNYSLFIDNNINVDVQ